MKRRFFSAAPLSAWVAALFTTLVIAAAYFAMGMFPFGEGSVALTDVNQQVIPLLAVFRDICAGRESIFYSFTQGGGMSLYGVFFFFLSSPFSFFSLLFSKADLPFAINLILAGKLICAAAAGGYASRKLITRLPWQFAALLGAAYGLCGYGLQYYQNILWLDIQILFPLLLVSLSCLFRKGKILPYTLLLTAMVVISYYLSYMLALFLILFAAGYLLLCRWGAPDRMARMLVGTILAALLSAVCWLPSLWASITSGRSENLLQKLADSGMTGPLETKLPIFLSTGLLLTLLFLFRTHLRRLDRLWLALLFLTALPVVVEPINRFWQWGDYQCFPVRYGFLPLFLVLLLAGRAMTPRRGLRPYRTRLGSAVGVYCTLVLLYCIWIYYSHFREGMDAYPATLWGDAQSLNRLAGLFGICAVSYALIVLLWRKRRIALPVAAVCLFLLCGMEGYLNLQVYLNKGLSKTDPSNYRLVMDVGSHLPDETFTRVGVEKKTFPSNWIGGAGMPSLGHYTSFTPYNSISLFRTLGYSSNWMELSAGGGTLFTDALLCRGYDITGRSEDAIYQNARYALVPHGDVLSFANYIPRKTTVTLPSGRIAAQEALFDAIFPDAGELFASYQPNSTSGCKLNTGTGSFSISSAGTLSYQCRVSDVQTLYLDCFYGVNTRITEPVYQSLRVSVNGKTLREEFPTAQENGLLCLGTFEHETVRVEIRVTKSISGVSFGLYGLRQGVLDEALSAAKPAAVQPDGGKISGTVSANEPVTLLCSVPYDENFVATANGVRLNTRSVGGFLAVDIPEGESDLTVKYHPSGFTSGLFLSVIGLLLLINGIWLAKREPELCRRCLAAINRPAGWIWLAGAAVVLAVLYVGTVMWCLL